MAGNEGQVRFSIESSHGVPGHDNWFTPFISESFKMKRDPEQDPSIDPSGELPFGDMLQADGTGKLTIVGDSESMLPIRAVHHGYNEVSTTGTGVRLWELRKFDPVGDTPVAYYDESLNFGLWRAERSNPSEYQVFDAIPMVYTVTQDEFKHVREEHDFLFRKDTFSHVVENAVDADFTGHFSQVGHRILGDETGDYFKFKITTAGDMTTAKGVWGKGVAAYSATEVPLATVMDVMTATDQRYAPREEPYQLQVVFGGVFTEDDEIFIYPTTPKPIAVFSARPKLNATKLELEITIGGVTLDRIIHKFSLSHHTPLEQLGGIGAKYSQRIDKPAEARTWWEVQLDTDYDDLKLTRAQLGAASVAVHAKFYGNKIGSTNLEDYLEFTLAKMRLVSAGTDGVSTPGRMPESPVLRTVPTAGVFPCIERRQNTITSITPT